MKRPFAFLLFVFLVSKAFGQNNLPPVFEITIDTATNIVLDDAYRQMLEDAEGKWTIDQVSRSPVADKFHYNITKLNGHDRSTNTYWFVYRFKNSMTHDAKIALSRRATSVDLYTLDPNGKWVPKITGTGVPWSKLDDLKQISTVTYTIQPGKELLIYERDNFGPFADKPEFPYVEFGFTDKVIEKYFSEIDPSILPSFLFGLLVLGALFNMYFFLIVHKRVYLFFSLMLLGRGLSRFIYDSNIFFPEHPVANGWLGAVSINIYFFFLIHFVRYFLETFKYFPRWDKFLIGLSIYIIIILSLGGPEPYVGAIIFFLFITFTLFIRSSDKSVRWRVVMVLPGICILLIPLLGFLFSSLKKSTGIQIPNIISWLGNHFANLEEIGLIWLLLVFSWSLFQRYQQLQKTIAQEALAKERLATEKEIERNQLIFQQKVELEEQVTERTAELKQSLEDLKSTQSQLIQSEKMASLGELTAGIAHEIQNPLNFVNNFSDVNSELIDEANQEIEKGNTDEVKAILNDIKDNEQKINHHGKRADSIVKGMLEHSRASTGQKELTDINKLADEYLRLAYHGLRAKDKSFNAKFETDLDPLVGKINIVPQEIGRVLLNVINNAFYAASQPSKGGLSYPDSSKTPAVWVRTKKENNRILISVRDNGPGIPSNMLDKIFQPFFTTKPTGQGTGLGLSLAYDIVKAHGGEIKVETKEGKGSEFIIAL